MNRPLSALLAALLFTGALPAQEPAQHVSADTPAAELVALTLRQAVERALAANFDVRIQRSNTDTARDEAVIAGADYAPVFSARAALSEDQSAGGFNGTIPVPGTLFESRDSRIGVSQKISTGATLTASSNLDRSQRNNTNPAYNADATLAVSQPLLKGAGRETNLAAIRRAELGIISADLGFKGTVLTVVRDVEAAYSRLVFSRNQLDVRAFSLEVAQKLAEENRAKRDSGVATDLDVLQADVGVANAQRDLLLAGQAVRDNEDTLLALIGGVAEQTVGPVALPEPAALPDADFARSYKLALDNFPDHADALVAVDRARVNVGAARRNRLPDLDLGAAVGLNSQQNDATSAIDELPTGDGYSWQVDLTLTLPWGLQADRARHRQALSELHRAETRLRQVDQDILVAVRAAVRAVETSRENVRITRLASELSERQFDLEKARYDAGLSTFRRVQEAREELDAARVNELQAQVDLRVARADLARLEGSTLDAYGIDLAQR
ncbi:MAG: TolC family protein [Verrucomicrobiota bacterium]